MGQLGEAGIGVSIYYATPVPLLTYYREKYQYGNGDFPNAEYIANQTISFPVGPHLTEENIDYIAAALERILATS